MTVSLYYDVLHVMDYTPRTKEEITSILFKDLKYESDKRSKAQNIYDALRQLTSEGKVKMERRVVGEEFRATYYLNDGKEPTKIQSRMEQVLSVMEDGHWYTTRELTVMLFGDDPIRYGVYRDRVARALNSLQKRGLVISKASHQFTSYGTEMKLWRMVL